MKLTKIITMLVIFAIGIAAGLFFAGAQEPEWIDTPDSALLPYNPFATVQAQPSPMDRVREEQIEVYSNQIILDIQDAHWARFTDTKSMEPVIHAGSNAIEVVPRNEDEVQVGDICSYEYYDEDEVELLRNIEVERAIIHGVLNGTVNVTNGTFSEESLKTMLTELDEQESWIRENREVKGSIIHRVVVKGEDEYGTYFVFKGDNLATNDPGRVRFDQIQRCVIAIIY